MTLIFWPTRRAPRAPFRPAARWRGPSGRTARGVDDVALGEEFDRDRRSPSAKNSRLPPGAKNGCTVSVSLTRSVPKLTTPLARALRAGDRCLRACFRDRSVRARPGYRWRSPAGQLGAGRTIEFDADQRRREAAVFGSLIVNSDFERGARAKDVAGVGVARDRHGLRFDVTVGAADAAAGGPRTARPSKARQVDALRISFLSSVDGQVRLDPGSSGAMPVRRYRDPRRPTPENSGDLHPEH